VKTYTFLLSCLIFFCGFVRYEALASMDDRLITEGESNAVIKKKESIEFKEDKILRSQLANFRVAVEELREEVRALGGKIEEIDFLLKNEMASLKEENDKRAKKIEEIVGILEKSRNRIMHIEQHFLTYEKKESVYNPVQKLSDVFYIMAKKNFDKGDMEKARSDFNSLLKQFPDSNHSDNAQFWIGESYYKEQWYEKAILEYQKVIEQYPNGNKVPAALLKQGLAFHSLGDKPSASLILKELIKKYPESEESKIAKTTLMNSFETN